MVTDRSDKTALFVSQSLSSYCQNIRIGFRFCPDSSGGILLRLLWNPEDRSLDRLRGLCRNEATRVLMWSWFDWEDS